MISISAWLTLWMVSIHLHQQQISIYWAAAWPGTWVASPPSAGSSPPFTDILQIKTLLNRSMLIGLKITNSNPIRISNLHLFEYSKQWYFAAKESTNMMLVVAATLPSPIWQQDNCTLQLSKYIISSPFSHESTHSANERFKVRTWWESAASCGRSC